MEGNPPQNSNQEVVQAKLRPIPNLRGRHIRYDRINWSSTNKVHDAVERYNAIDRSSKDYAGHLNILGEIHRYCDQWLTKYKDEHGMIPSGKQGSDEVHADLVRIDIERLRSNVTEEKVRVTDQRSGVLPETEQADISEPVLTPGGTVDKIFLGLDGLSGVRGTLSGTATGLTMLGTGVGALGETAAETTFAVGGAVFAAPGIVENSLKAYDSSSREEGFDRLNNSVASREMHEIATASALGQRHQKNRRIGRSIASIVSLGAAIGAAIVSGGTAGIILLGIGAAVGAGKFIEGRWNAKLDDEADENRKVGADYLLDLIKNSDSAAPAIQELLTNTGIGEISVLDASNLAGDRYIEVHEQLKRVLGRNIDKGIIPRPEVAAPVAAVSTSVVNPLRRDENTDMYTEDSLASNSAEEELQVEEA